MILGLRCIGIWLCILCTLLPVGILAQNFTDADLTTCGKSCMVQTLDGFGCSIDDASCQCRDDTLTVATACLSFNCTMADTLRVFKVQASICNLPDETRAMGTIVGGFALILIAVFFTFLRFMSKYMADAITWGDWALVSCAVLAIVAISLSLHISFHGWGKHMWQLEDGQLLTVLKDFYVAQAIFPILLGLVKTSIVLFYLNIFPSKNFRVAACIVIAYTAVTTMTTDFIVIFSCSPVAYFWNKDIRGGTCMSIYVSNLVGAILGITQDIAIILLPVWQIRKLQMKKRKKVFVMVMFGLGSLGCVASLIRLVGVFSQRTIVDPTWDFAELTTWSGVELGIAFVCACLPSVRRLLSRVFPKIFGADTKNNISTPSSTGLKSANRGAAIELQRRNTKSTGNGRAWDQISDEEIILPPQHGHHDS